MGDVPTAQGGGTQRRRATLRVDRAGGGAVTYSVQGRLRASRGGGRGGL